MSGVFHAGEEVVQKRAGVFDQAARLGPRMVQRALNDEFAQFLASEPVIFLSASAPSGPVWVSALFGPPGFAAATSARQVRVRTAIGPADPLSPVLDAGAAVGVLVLEPMTRSRIRLNGSATRTADGFTIELKEVFGNCPKYIQRRHPIAVADELTGPKGDARARRSLDEGQRTLVRSADTFFIGSRHPAGGADTSHRGGRPGFVAVSEDGSSLVFPDYQGNNMFQTLGNLAVDPAIGLLFIDWLTGRTLQLTGSAEIVWADDRVTRWPKAQRLLDVAVDQVIDRPDGLPLMWELVETHRLNPAVPESETAG